MVAPDRGDVVWVNLDPTKGREQAGTRPAVVLSPKSYNHKSSLVIACPMTTQIKGYPFEVVCRYKNKPAAILVDQIKSFDWRVRTRSIDGRIDDKTLQALTAKLSLLIDLKQ